MKKSETIVFRKRSAFLFLVFNVLFFLALALGLEAVPAHGGAD